MTWTIADGGTTAPLSPASIVTLQEERSVAASHPPLPLTHSFFQCDRKRPCQRCIQLGLVITVPSFSPSRLVILTPPPQTGLCVYEIDDPSIRFVPVSRARQFVLNVDPRDDPNVDENTHFRNRIAELESLVRELRGKPSPLP